MIYLNECLGPLKHIVFDCYEAITVEDFKKSKDDLPEPSLWKVLSPFGALIMGSNVMVEFKNIDLTFADNSRYKISDLTNHIETEPNNHGIRPFNKSERGENLTEGRYYKLNINYNPIKETTYIIIADRYGPPSRESSQDASGLENLIP